MVRTSQGIEKPTPSTVSKVMGRVHWFGAIFREMTRTPLSAEIAASALITTESVPTDPVLLQVVGAGTEAGYLYGGLTTAAGIRGILGSLGFSIGDFRRVLDWGCGLGRVVRWFEDVGPGTEFVGTDISEKAVLWCSENMHFGSYRSNDYLPPLPFPDEHFDLIYGISVLTHLPEDFQHAWLAELRRVARPGAIVLLTVHAEDVAEALPPLELREFRRRGFFYKHVGDAPVAGTPLEGMPDFYQVAFHSRPYIQRIWSRFFEPLTYVKHGPMWLQEMVVLRKTTGRRWPRLIRGHPAVWNLPLAALDQPAVGSVVTGLTLNLSGWAFESKGESLRLRVWLDGEPAGRCVADGDRPDVLAVFPRSPAALRSGYVAAVDVRQSRRGSVALWVTSENNGIPLATTFVRLA
jgi:SAM-dependent methyltransferase